MHEMCYYDGAKEYKPFQQKTTPIYHFAAT